MIGSRQAIRPAVAAVARKTASVDQRATMATLREIEMRLKSVRNIEKITKSMKVVASTKLTRAERAMKQAKKYGAANEVIFDEAKLEENPDAKILYVAITSDRGLCGGIHSSVSKAVKAAIATAPGSIAVIGDKPKAQLSRVVPEAFTLSFNQIGKDVPTFAEAAAIADEITTKGGDYDVIKLVYNKYVSAISYEAAIKTISNQKTLSDSAGFKAYEMEEDVSKDLTEFGLANTIYSCLVEGHAAEISARRTAMENASNNAGDMIGSLNLKYNRGRQAQITNELIDIITGASAL